MQQRILKAVSEAGWYQDRKIDISYMTDDLNRYGFTTPNVLINSVLKEFGNIRIEGKTEKEIYVNILLNTEEGMQATSAILNELVEKIINEKAVPIGTIQDSYVIWITYSGKFYLDDSKFVYYINNNIFSLFEFIFSDLDLTNGIKYR